MILVEISTCTGSSVIVHRIQKKRLLERSDGDSRENLSTGRNWSRQFGIKVVNGKFIECGEDTLFRRSALRPR